MTYDCLLQPALTIYYDFDEVDGFYTNFSVGHSFTINDKLGIDLAGSAGYGDRDYNKAYFGVNDRALVDANASVAAPFQITEKITITPMLILTSIIDSDLRDSVENNSCCDNETNIYGGITVGFSF
jgi:outer membrane scaffolding protein for murein synthesis (MipA/OmpV family)